MARTPPLPFLPVALALLFVGSPAGAQVAPATTTTPSPASPDSGEKPSTDDRADSDTASTSAAQRSNEPIGAGADPTTAPAATTEASTQTKPAAPTDTSPPSDTNTKGAEAKPQTNEVEQTRSSTLEDAARAARDAETLNWVSEHFFAKIRVRGYTQFRLNQPTTNPDLVNFQADKSVGGETGFSIRRARLVLYGDIHPLVYMYLQADFAGAASDAMNVAQMRDWYFDIQEPKKEFRIRIGQSKVPYGFENMQSSQNRLNLDRSDAINSALPNERDLGAFFYWAPAKIRERFTHLIKSGFKGSGDYGVVGLGVYNGQGTNKPELNSNKHVVARVTYPFQFGEQFVEVGGGGYVGQYVPTLQDGVTGDDEYLDARGHVAVIIYPQPFGLTAEFNVGVGPELQNFAVNPDGSTPPYSGAVESEFLHGGYVLASYKLDTTHLGSILPFCRAAYYEGGKKQMTNAPHYSVREIEGGVEWQPIPAIEFVGALNASRRTSDVVPYDLEEGFLGRFQLQLNY